MLLRTFFPFCLLVCGCTSVVIDDDPPGSDPACEAPFVAEDLVHLGRIQSATMIGHTLHVEGVVDGQEAYAIIDLSSDPAQLLELRSDLLGGARWTDVGGGLHARMRVNLLDVMDSSDPAHPRILSTTAIGTPPPPDWAGVLGAGDGGVFLCMQSGAPDESYLARIDLTDPAHPGVPAAQNDYPCTAYGDHHLAAGSLWITHDESNMALFDLLGGGESSLVSHGFNTEGVHHYGEFTAVQTDGQVVATTLENDAYAFLYYRDEPAAEVVYSSFGHGDKQLIAVVSGQALLVEPGDDGERRVIAFDISVPPAFETPAEETEMDVILDGAEGPLASFRALAHDADRVLIGDEASVYLVPLGSTAAARPLVLVRPGAQPLPCR